MGSFLIIDDHSVVREGLGRLLAAEFPDATFRYAASRQEALAALDGRSYDFVVLDISLPGGDGFGLIHDIQNRSPEARILIHTMHSEEQFGVRALRAGADGFITKDAPVSEIFFAVRKILQSGRYLSSTLADILVGSLSTGSGGGVDSLSNREFEFLRFVTAGKTPTEIAEDLNLSIKTISTYRTRLLEKLNLRTTADLIRYGIEHHVDGTPNS